MSNLPKKRISILIAEDHRVTLEGIESWLAKMDDFEIAGRASNSDDAINLAMTAKPDIILLDLHLPGKRGIEEMLRDLASASSKIVVFSAEDRPPVVKLVLAMGASAFLSKSESFETICQVIREVFSGTTGYVSTNLRRRKKYELFSAEEEVLRMLAKGMKYEEIGEARHTSPHTVRKQCDRLQQKLRLTSREALIVWAVENGFGAPSKE